MKLPPPETIADQQATEIEVLKSILDEDFVVVPPKTAWKNAAHLQLHQFEIILRPEDDALKEQVSALMEVKLPKTYPFSAPVVSIPLSDPAGKDRVKGIRRINLKNLEQHLVQKCSALPSGTEMIWELVGSAQEYISVHHGITEIEKAMPNMSLEEQMRLRAQEQEKVQAQAQQEARRIVSEQEERKAKDLALAIQLEEERKAEAMQLAQQQKLGAKKSNSNDSVPKVKSYETSSASSHQTSARVETFLDPLEEDGNRIHAVRVGPLIESDGIRCKYLADSAEADKTGAWQLEQYDILSSHYSTLPGKKQLEEVEWELERLRNTKSPYLLDILAASLSRKQDTEDESLRGWKMIAVTERPPGPCLLDVLEQCNTLPWAKVRLYTREILAGLEVLHTSALVHRSLGPRVMYLRKLSTRADHSSTVKIADCSYHQRLIDMARSAPFRTGINQVPSERFLDAWDAPEAGHDKLAYSRSRDMWDLGRLLCQMLFGISCTQEYSSPAALIDSPSNEGLAAGITLDVRGFIKSLLDTNPRRRPTAKAALAMLDDLIAFEESAKVGSTTFIPPQPSVTSPGAATARSFQKQTSSAHLLGTSPDIQGLTRPGSFWQVSRSAAADASLGWSRYKSDFEEIEFLGKGAFGSVVKARNKLDGRFYAIKKIRLSDSPENDERTLREVTALSRLNHAHVVRYVTCWIEQEAVALSGASASTGTATSHRATESAGISRGASGSDAMAGSNVSFHLDLDAELEADFLSVGHDAFSKSASYPDIDFAKSSESSSDGDFETDSDDSNDRNRRPSTKVRRISKSRDGMKDIWSRARISSVDTSEPSRNVRRTLLIQMEFISGSTLRDAIDRGLSVEEAWRLFRQMLEALAHINSSMGIIHRDLKPSNVLMSGESEVKIGDFGLATTDATKALDEIQGAVKQDPSHSIGDLTGDVGTNLYMSPEVVKGVGRYDAKVDMYSLGIIFFEMLASQRAYKTGMERVAVLRTLRGEGVQLPSGWPFASDAPETKVVKWLLTHKPADRPTPIQLLKSDLLPPKLEDDYIEECLRLMANPSSTYNDRLLDALFERDDVDDVRDFTFDMGAETDADRPLITAVCDHLRSIFQRHGAVQLRVPPLIPPNEFYSSQVQERKMVRLLDRSGRLVFLPFDGLLPFVRAFRTSATSRFKRFDIAAVFRDNPIAGGQPRSVLEVNFDIISPEKTAVSEAEIFKLLQEIVEEIPGLRHEWVIQVNHRAILDLLLERIPKAHHTAVASAFAPYLSLKQSAGAQQSIRAKLLDLRIPRSIIDELEAANLGGSVDSVKVKLERLVPIEHRQLLTAAVSELKEITTSMRSFGVNLDVHFTPLLAQNAPFFKGGTIFQLCRLGKKRIDVFAAGGRYDSLLKRFANPTTSGSGRSIPHGVGVQIAVGKIALALARYQELQVPHLMSKMVEEERSFGWWTPRRCDVYIAGPSGSLELRAELCRDLWAAGLSADLMYENMTSMTPDRLIATCKEEGILFLVTVRPRHDTVKVRNVLHRSEDEVLRDGLVYWLQEHLTKQRMVDQQQLGGQLNLHAAGPVSLSALGGGGTAAGVAHHSSRVGAGVAAKESNMTCQVVMPALKYPGREDKSGKNSKDRKQSRSTKQVIIEKATRDAQRLGEDIVQGCLPILAVDLGQQEIERLAAHILREGEAGFKTYLESLTTPAEKDYVKLIRSQLLAALQNGSGKFAGERSSGEMRAIIYSVRDERTVLLQ